MWTCVGVTKLSTCTCTGFSLKHVRVAPGAVMGSWWHCAVLLLKFIHKTEHAQYPCSPTGSLPLGSPLSSIGIIFAGVVLLFFSQAYSESRLASYPGLLSQLFSQPWKKTRYIFSHGCEKSCEKSCERRPGYEASLDTE